MNYTNFNKVTELPIGLGLGKIEYEELVCYMLNKYIDEQLEFNIPLVLKNSHTDMVKEGWLIRHGYKNEYTLSQKTIGILYGKYGKTNTIKLQYYPKIDNNINDSGIINENTDFAELNVIEMLHPDMKPTLDKIRYNQYQLAKEKRIRDANIDKLILLHKTELDKL